MTDEHKEYLDTLWESGAINMFGATPYLIHEFGIHDKVLARQIINEWMRHFFETKDEKVEKIKYIIKDGEYEL